YERFEVPNGLTYVTCAGGGGTIGNVSENVSTYPADAALRVAFSDRYHPCLYYVSSGKLSSKVVAEDGTVIDQFAKAGPYNVLGSGGTRSSNLPVFAASQVYVK